MLKATAFVFLLLGFQQGLADECFKRPVGISDQAKIPDYQMTAFSQWNDRLQPAYGRLNGVRGDGWCAKEAARSCDWLQVDLGTTFKVCGTATQGDRNGYEWVTAFRLSYSLDGNVWTTYKDENGMEVEFRRQGERNTVDQHHLPVPVTARFFRFHPTKQHAWNCLRVELYGEPVDYWTKPVGISDQAKIKDNQMTATSQLNSWYQPAYGRLNEDRGGGWCAKERASDDDWLMVDLGTTFQVCGMATQGDRYGLKWVTDFKMSYSSDGSLWTTFKDENDEEVEFHRQGSNTIDQHQLPVPVTARFFRFHPTKQHNWNCLRVELYGESTEPPTQPPTQSPEPTYPPTEPPVCEDSKPAKKCKQLKNKGHCVKPGVKSHCQKTCGVCGGGGVCENKRSAKKCKMLEKKGGCKKPKVRSQCQKTCGICGGGICQNKWPAKKCKMLEKEGGCKKPEVRSQCQKTCGICGEEGQ